MPRGRKCRRVCFEPVSRIFLAEGKSAGQVIISVEELEALRLVDQEGMEQGTAAESMNISRGTFQRILYAARQKAAEALSQGKSIRIEGGDYQVSESCPQRKRCCGHCRLKEKRNDEEQEEQNKN